MSRVIAEGSYPAPREWLDIPKIKDYSLIFPIDRSNNKVLLGYKKRGFAQGIWNGFGGKPEPGEDMLQCASRELTEESGLTPTHLIPRGTLLYYSSNALIREGGDHAVKVWLYTCEAWTGEVVETEEMRPEWYTFPKTLQEPFDELPWDRMHIESHLFLPTLLLLPFPDSDHVHEQKLSGRADFYPCGPDSPLLRDLKKKGEQLDWGKKTAMGDWVLGRWSFWVGSGGDDDAEGESGG